ncbi:unnamed protein product [Cuscuta epithymum]|uniref:GRF-type domain-containing protein n=1 Tax=Cuscuta epithymum TaxID=186058 RepID=A0AAV0EXD3_9ASTE|nr:unnamed protein product [Cuscuta epithymum]CAH9127919.1 unnamed protein product [Cuscuta epithymum]
MIALEHNDPVQLNCEAPIKCLQNTGYPHNLNNNGTSIKNMPELSEGTGSTSAGDTNSDCSSGSEPLGSSKESPQKTVKLRASGSWTAFYPGSNNMRLCAVNAFEPQFYPSVDRRFRYGPIKTIYGHYPCEFQFQDIQYFVVIDFEATCDKERNPHPQEIIEFPSVIVSSMTGQLEACFQTYVRPTCNELLSDFCKDLTGIQQIQVDRGVTLSEALHKHDKWLEKKGIKHSNFAVVTWSNWDCRVMLESECRYKKIQKPPYFNKWINLKVPFRETFGGGRCTLKEAVQLAGIEWQGRAHCGLDDAKNTARLLTLFMHKGIKLSITDSLTFQPISEPFAWKPTPRDHVSNSPYQTQKVRNQHFPTIQIQMHSNCYCGIRSTKGVVQKPGPKQGSVFFGCGNWTAIRGARCHYFEWAYL